MSDWIERLRAAWGRLSGRERVLVSAVTVLFALLFVMLVVVNPLLAASESARSRTQAAVRELEAVEAMRAELDEVQGRLSTVERRIRESPQGNIFTTLESLASQSGLKVDSMEPQTSPSSDAYRETKVQVTLKGVSLAQLTDYLHRIESARQLLSIKSLRIRTRPDGSALLDVNFSVSSFQAV